MKRLGSAATMGAAVLELSDDNWLTLENAIGGGLPPDTRTRIIEIVNKYFERSMFEWNALFLKGALDVLNEIKGGAKKLKSILDKHVDQPGLDCEPSSDAEARQFEIYRASCDIDFRVADCPSSEYLGQLAGLN